jgi:hypothetical protein
LRIDNLFGHTELMSATTERDIATHTAPKDFGKALALARVSKAPWFRCQALAWVARFAPDNEVVKVAEEALSSAFSADDCYKIVGASAWPLRALIERDHAQRISRWLPKLLEASANITNPVNRLDALYLLWQAVYPAVGLARKQVSGALIAACLSADSWKAGHTMREVVLVIAQENVSEAAQFIDSMPDGVYKRQAQRRVAEGKPGYVRPFFWKR